MCISYCNNVVIKPIISLHEGTQRNLSWYMTRSQMNKIGWSQQGTRRS